MGAWNCTPSPEPSRPWVFLLVAARDRSRLQDKEEEFQISTLLLAGGVKELVFVWWQWECPVVLLALVWRVHNWGLRYQAKHGLPFGIPMGWEAVPPLLTCCVTLRKSLSFSGLTFPKKEIRKCFM